MNKSEVVALGIILLSFIIGIYFYNQMPEKMAIHWNVKGEVDSYASKFLGLFLIPVILLMIFLLFIAIPRIDPLKQNIEEFRKYYNGFIILTIGFLFYTYILTILWNYGFRFSIAQLITPAFGILFYYCGILIENAKRNWFIGIRTPWTLSSEEVWNRTHRIGGRLFKLAGIISFAGVTLQKYALFFVLVPVLLISIYTVIYSYLEYQRVIKCGACS
ncbi:MAG: hypothetical protein DRN95_01450 [Candidatus Hydrothermarchaeota archaeon]|nr:MAG: hypothetical protein DRN95_01450 [Candidatus Hydrothermarchaeota archaeon]